MLNKKQVLLIAGFTVALIGLGALTGFMFRDIKSQESGTLLANTDQTAPSPTVITDEDTAEAYLSRPAFTSEVVDTLPERVIASLTVGDFSRLDAYLKELADTYRDTVHGDDVEYDVSYALMIARYRGDIALINNSDKYEGDGDMLTLFQTPDILAAETVFAPAMLKYNSFINMDSVIIVGVQKGTDIDLRRVELTAADKEQLMAGINARLTEKNKYADLFQYEFKINGTPYRLLIVSTVDECYYPYSLEVDKEKLPDGARANVFLTASEFREAGKIAESRGEEFGGNGLVAPSSTGVNDQIYDVVVPPFQLPEGYVPPTLESPSITPVTQSASINQNPVFENGKASGNLLIRNPGNTALIVRIETKNEQVIYTSDIILSGENVDEDTLDTELAAGDYPCTAYLISADNNGNVTDTAMVQITIHIQT